MNNLNYIIYGPGRTGSQLITNELANFFTSEYTVYYDVLPDINPKAIIHTHNPNSKILNKEDFVCILSRRRDELAGILSEHIAMHTGEYGIYYKFDRGEKIDPFILAKEKILGGVHARRDFYSQIDTLGYAKVVDIYLEDMLQYPYYLFESLGIPNVNIEYHCTKCPYGTELIINIDEIREYYQEIK